MSSRRSRSENGHAHSAAAMPPLSSASPRTTTSSTWPLDVSSMSPKPPAGSPPAASFKRRRRAVSTMPRSPLKRTPRSQQTSPSLAAAALNVANGAGHTAVGFLKECLHDAPAEVTSWSCIEPWATAEGMDIVMMAPLKLLDIKDVSAPVFPATGSERPSRLRIKHRSSAVSSCIVREEIERCSCCTKEEFWVLYDVFASMDRRHEESVRRVDFVWALGAHGASVDFQRIVRKSQLSAYFKATAHDISLEEFIKRVFPNANSIDALKMERWVSLRKAHNLLTSPDFIGSSEELRQMFSLLEEGCSGTISGNDLLRAQILSHLEILAPMAPSSAMQLSFDFFTEYVAPIIVSKFVTQKDFGKENSPVDSVIQCGMKEKLGTAKPSFRFPFVSINDHGQISCKTDVDVSSMNDIEQAAVVSAY